MSSAGCTVQIESLDGVSQSSSPSALPVYLVDQLGMPCACQAAMNAA
jgi:hypothetical protein